MTDLELMQLLDEQGYEATLENLEILKEGLESGAYEIKNVATIEKKPSELTSDIDNEDIYDDEEHEQEEEVGKVVIESFSDYELYKLLESEGYETTNENLKILKEGLYSGEIEILNEMKNSTRKKIASLAMAGAIGLAGAGIAHANQGMKSETERATIARIQDDTESKLHPKTKIIHWDDGSYRGYENDFRDANDIQSSLHKRRTEAAKERNEHTTKAAGSGAAAAGLATLAAGLKKKKEGNTKDKKKN